MAVSGQDIVNYLLQFKGVPYVWGGEDPSGFDCSGLMLYGFNHFGIKIPRVTYDQIGVGQAIDSKGLRVGDLVFFDTDRTIAGPDHVGIYMGDGKMFHTPRPGKSAEVVSITSGYYMDRFMGGRRINGVIATGGNPGDFGGKETQRQLTPEELAVSYGWSISFFNTNPELKKIFDQAVSGTWTKDKFQAAIRDTNWFKTTSETARQAQVMEKTDPATWDATIKAATARLQKLAGEVGAALPTDRIKPLAESIIRTGMTDDEIRHTLGGFIEFTEDGFLKGQAGMHEYTMRQYANQMGVQISDQAIKNQAALIIQKLNTIEDFKSLTREQAKSAFPGYEKQIDAGLTVEEIAAPYRAAAATELEVPEPDIDDPMIRNAMNGMSQDGTPSGVPLWQFQQQLHNDPRWRETENAQNRLTTVGKKVLEDLGLV